MQLITDFKAEATVSFGSIGNREPVGSFEKGKASDARGQLARRIRQLSAGRVVTRLDGSAELRGYYLIRA